MKITFQKSKSDIPLIRFRLPGNDKYFTALVDTGSEVTLADETFVGENDIEPIQEGEMKLQSINDKISHKTSKIQFDILFGRKKYTANCLTTDLSRISAQFNRQYNEGLELSLLIGSDFLSDNKVDIDYKNKVIVINS